MEECLLIHSHRIWTVLGRPLAIFFNTIKIALSITTTNEKAFNIFLIRIRVKITHNLIFIRSNLNIKFCTNMKSLLDDY